MTSYPPAPITNFRHQIAVITGGGSGMGRELAVQLATEGASVAICDLDETAMATTIELATGAAVDGDFAASRFTSFPCDVADPEQMKAFAHHVHAEFRTDFINLLFNNAGIGGGGSFVQASNEAWDRTFGICWGGVLNGSRAFLQLLLASERGQVINTSSINGMWAALGSKGPHTAYSAAKFAVKGFTEALMVDFRIHAPHLTAAVVMPGHIGTQIMANSYEAFGRNPRALTAAHVAELRADLTSRGIDVETVTDDELRALLVQHLDQFENEAPTTAADATKVILDGIRSGLWRILVGQDAHALDEALRADPTAAYTDEFSELLRNDGHFGGLIVQ